jgi:hypothetical protein
MQFIVAFFLQLCRIHDTKNLLLGYGISLPISYDPLNSEKKKDVSTFVEWPYCAKANNIRVCVWP